MKTEPTLTGSASFASRLVEATREAAGRFEATLSNPYWDATGKLEGVYCFKCAKTLFPRRIDGGWVNEEDQPRHCGTCSAPLDFTLTDYGVEQMLEAIEENGIHTDEDAYGVHQMMHAGGNPLLTESCGEWCYRPEWKGRIQAIYETLEDMTNTTAVDSALVRPPHEIGALKATTINQWRDWFKSADGGKGMYGPDRLLTIDRICDAAIIGTTGVMSSQADYRMTCAAWLRDAADQIESAV